MINRRQLFDLKSLCDNVCHCGDYGCFYLTKNCKELIVVLGDADNPLMDKLEEFCKILEIKLTVEAEYEPEGKFVLISRGIESNWYDHADSETDENQEDNPRYLKVEEYVDFLRFSKKLKV